MLEARIKSGRSRRRINALVTAIALILAAVHVAWPNLKIDTITVILLVVALLPWLGGLVESIEMPGGWKVQYLKLEEQVADISVQATGASQTAQAALGAASSDISQALNVHPLPLETIKRVSAEYTTIRAMPQSPERTESMNRLFGRLIALAPLATGFDVSAALRDDDPGIRLSAYAYLYARPDSRFLQELVQALVEREDKNFSQYWAIRTAGLLMQEIGVMRVPESILRELRSFLRRLPEGTDRRFELTRLLAPLDLDRTSLN